VSILTSVVGYDSTEPAEWPAIPSR